MEHLEHFGLTQDPFQNNPQLAFYFASPQHTDAERRLLRGVRQGKGLSVIVGASGSGKTTLVSHLMEGLDEDTFEASLIVMVHTGVDSKWLLACIARQLGVEEPAPTRVALVGQIYRQLVAIREEGRRPVIVIDEAQMLTRKETQTELRGLLNLEWDEERLISLVLSGLPELEQTLALDPPLAERVDIRVELACLDAGTASAYLAHRVRTAGGDPEILHPQAMARIAELSEGIPRRLNTLADNALFEAYLAGRRQVSIEDVERAARDLSWARQPVPEPVVAPVQAPVVAPVQAPVAAPVQAPAAVPQPEVVARAPEVAPTPPPAAAPIPTVMHAPASAAAHTAPTEPPEQPVWPALEPAHAPEPPAPSEPAGVPRTPHPPAAAPHPHAREQHAPPHVAAPATPTLPNTPVAPPPASPESWAPAPGAPTPTEPVAPVSAAGSAPVHAHPGMPSAPAPPVHGAHPVPEASPLVHAPAPQHPAAHEPVATAPQAAPAHPAMPAASPPEPEVPFAPAPPVHPQPPVASTAAPPPVAAPAQPMPAPVAAPAAPVAPPVAAAPPAPDLDADETVCAQDLSSVAAEVEAVLGDDPDLESAGSFAPPEEDTVHGRTAVIPDGGLGFDPFEPDHEPEPPASDSTFNDDSLDHLFVNLVEKD